MCGVRGQGFGFMSAVYGEAGGREDGGHPKFSDAGSDPPIRRPKFVVSDKALLQGGVKGLGQWGADSKASSSESHFVAKFGVLEMGF